MDLLTVTASTDLDRAISSILPMMAFWMIGAVLLLGCIMVVGKYIESWRLETELAELQDWNMALHDSWRSSAGRREFEQHQRGCRRCRGDVFGQLDFDLPKGIQPHTLKELRDSKAKQKSRRAELKSQS